MTIRRVPFDEIPQSLRDELTKAGLDAGEVYDAVELALDEDLPSVAPGEMPSEDVTSVATIAPDSTGIGVFAAREDGVVAGLGVAELVFAYVMGDSVTVTDRVKDGSKVKAGDIIMRIAGPTRGLLTAERTALNYASGPWRSTRCAAAAAPTTGCRWPTWRWSRTTTSSPRVARCRLTRP